MQPDKLILFDIDGTLLHCGSAARESLAEALSEVTGSPLNLRLEDVAGNTALGIIRTALERVGALEPDPEQTIKAVSEKYLEILKVKYPARGDQYLYPGVEELLQRVCERDDIRMGLLTGNLEQGAKVKLEPFGIWDDFALGAFGSDSKDRNELPKIAWQKAREQLDEVYGARQTMIIGDTPRDAVCAMKNNTHSIIILRREIWREAVEVENPDYIVDSTENVDQLLEYLIGYYP